MGFWRASDCPHHRPHRWGQEWFWREGQQAHRSDLVDTRPDPAPDTGTNWEKHGWIVTRQPCFAFCFRLFLMYLGTTQNLMWESKYTVPLTASSDLRFSLNLYFNFLLNTVDALQINMLSYKGFNTSSMLVYWKIQYLEFLSHIHSYHWIILGKCVGILYISSCSQQVLICNIV